MFEELRNAFREAVENFRREMGRDDVPEAVSRLLAGMRDEAAEAGARLKLLEKEVAETRERVTAEAQQEAICRRREEMARRIDDEETARVAGEYAERHARRREVLEAKAEALERERVLGQAEYDDMVARLKEARDNRASLAAAAGRTDARESIRESDDLFADLDRMAEKIADEGRRGEAAEAMSYDDLDGPSEDAGGRMDDRPRPPVDVDARLEELKRRMGKDPG